VTHSDPYLFAWAIAKCALMTGIGPAIAAAALYLEWRKRFKAEAGKVIQFPGPEKRRKAA